MPEYIESKTILSKIKNGPDPYFGVAYSMNIYRGCQHQCIYCDTRSKVYGIGELSRIRIKKNALRILSRELKSKRKKATIGTGSMNDPYMPVEAREGIIRSALEIIKGYRFPVHTITKSDLVLRDMDILKEISKVYAAVSFTVTTSDDALSKVIEPGAVVSSKRIKAMNTLAGNGIYTGIVLSPVLPFITDNKENIRDIVRRAADNGASYILCWTGMTQREGQREYFYNKLDTHFPGLSAKYRSRYGNNYNCSVPEANKLYDEFRASCEKNNISRRMVFYSPDNNLQMSLFN